MRLPLPSPILQPAGYLLLVLFVLLILCLWPFNFLQTNNVTWNASGGIHFSAPGTAYTSIPPNKLARLEKFTILLHLFADDPGEASWIASYGLDYDHFNFMIGQHTNQLVFEMRTASGRVNTRIRVPKPFEERREARIAIVYDGRRLSAYIGGERKAETKLTEFDNSSWTAESPLVFGSGTNGKFPWDGTIYRFAILDTAVPERNLVRFDSLCGASKPVVHYDFSKGGVDDVADHGTGMASDLTIPRDFHPYTTSLLLTPKVYWLPIPLYTDIIANVLAFIPVGFLFGAALSTSSPQRWSMLVAAIVLSFLVSLGIELLQALLPSRWSTMMDVLMNTLGGAIGALVFWRGWFERMCGWMHVSFRERKAP